ncbi:MAG: hypothetical protein OQK70_11905 [Gammaproteobacteria bacterium]|nr:hypothetical protein [Gammaproteobacteria bacterium]
MQINKSLSAAFVGALFLLSSIAQAWTHYGHIKYSFNYTDIPSDSVIYLDSGDQQSLNSLSLRLASEHKWNDFSAEIHYEMNALHSNNPDLITGVDADKNRALDLSSNIRDENNDLQQHRIDRLSLAYSHDQLVVRLGRQAVSWGNGFVFHPMDIINPFDPVAIDKDYKTGDDMLYGQWLMDNGNDWQMMILPRRNLSGDIDNDQASQAIKFHALTPKGDVDVLYARHYDQAILALGYAKSILDAVWRLDVLVTELSNQQKVTMLMSNLDYSCVWLEHNVYGFAEYFYNELGEADFSLSPDAELSSRLSRGELFTTAKHYLSLGLNIELHPLVNLSPTMIVNLDDNSYLMPITLNYNWTENRVLKTSLILSAGDSLSEYGGPASPGNQFNLLFTYYF